MKVYYEQINIGKAKYVVNFHNGVNTHKDGSEFYDIRVFNNKKAKNDFVLGLVNQGYAKKSKAIGDVLKPKTYQAFMDSGHGWLKVNKSELVELGIADKISGYSYMKGDFAYLEEDLDLTTFVDAIGKDKWSQCKTRTNSSNNSRIRLYDSYQYYNDVEQAELVGTRRALLNSGINWSKTAVNKIKNANLDYLRYWRKFYKLEVKA